MLLILLTVCHSLSTNKTTAIDNPFLSRSAYRVFLLPLRSSFRLSLVSLVRKSSPCFRCLASLSVSLISPVYHFLFLCLTPVYIPRSVLCSLSIRPFLPIQSLWFPSLFFLKYVSDIAFYWFRELSNPSLYFWTSDNLLTIPIKPIPCLYFWLSDFPLTTLFSLIPYLYLSTSDLPLTIPYLVCPLSVLLMVTC